MRLFGCLNPKIIKNPYTGQVVQCRCGKCSACRNTKNSNWVIRLDLEAQCHKYVLFTTLTYDEYNVPQIIKLKFDDYHPYEKNNYAYLGQDGELIDIREIKEPFEKKDFDYIRKSDFLNVLDKSDFQKFIKRLRYYFDQCEKGALLRYFLCGELGPRTFRPHGHLLLFFDSEKCAREIQLLLSKAWTYGNIYDPHFVHGSAASYVASYCNGLSNLPKIYLHPSLKPFTLFSKNPAIGSIYPNVKEVREIFNRGDITFQRFDDVHREFKNEYFWRSFTSRLYPRCQRFDSLLHDDRVTLYRLIEEFPTHLNAVEIAKRIESEYVFNPRYTGVESNSFLHRYFWCISHSIKKGYKLRTISDYNNPIPANLPFPVPDDYPDRVRVTSFLPDTVQRYNFNSILAFVRCTLRVRHQAQIFGVSIPYYVSKIEQFYENLKKKRLYDDYLYQTEYFENHPRWHWIYFDLSFYRLVTTQSFDLLTDSYKFFLNDLFSGSIPLKRADGKDILDIPKPDELLEYQQYKLLHDVITHRTTKQKSNNDYALARKDKFGNVINYQKLD